MGENTAVSVAYECERMSCFLHGFQAYLWPYDPLWVLLKPGY